MRLIIALLYSLTLLAASCTKKSSECQMKGDYIIVGRTNSKTATSDYRLIKNGLLKTSTVHKKMGTGAGLICENDFDVVLPDTSHQKVANLRGTIPSELLSQNNHEFGETYRDAMRLHVYTTINGTQYQWSFVGNLDKESTAIQEFAQTADKAFN